MTDIIDKVAEAIKAADNLPHTLRYGAYDYSGYPGEGAPYVVKAPGQREIVFASENQAEAEAHWERAESRRIATAALEALAEGLVWKVSQLNGEYYLRLPDGGIVRDVGSIHRHGNRYGGFFLGRLVERDDGQRDFKTQGGAKTAVMNTARRVLFGLGPVGGGNG